MADFTSHKPGTFSWPELATTDQKGGVAFYKALFGWDVNEQPIGPDDVYSMFQMRGKPVGAGYSMRPDERSMGSTVALELVRDRRQRGRQREESRSRSARKCWRRPSMSWMPGAWP